jgi:Ca-activated chloride channel family protein
MILWRDPISLTALAVLPALVAFLIWARRRRQRALAAFVAAGLLPAVAPDLDPRRRTARAVLFTAATLCLIVALGGPMWGFRWEEVRREGIDLVVAIDTSRSMLATDVKPSRLARAKLAVQDLLSQLHGDRIGLVAFAGTAFVQCPLTLDYGAFGQSLEAIDVGIIPKGGTALGAAIDASLDAFDGHEGKHQALVLITDGEDHEGKVKEATGRASTRGVKIYTVGIGTTEGELIPGESGGYVKDRSGQVVKSRLDEETLKQIAIDTGGVYLRAGGASLGLPELYRDYIGAMEKRELASTLERRFKHRFQIPLALAFVLLLVEYLLGERRLLVAPPLRRWRLPLVAMALAVVSIGWLDPHERTREANRLFAAGKYDDAAAKYNDALVDHPDSPLLHFNLGDTAYKQGKYQDAINAFQQVPTGDDDPARTARVAYNLGNAEYRLGQAAEASDPKTALARYAEALVAYRRAMGAAPDDLDAKINYEFVAKKIEDLKKKLEEQQKRQEQQEQQKQPEQQEQQGQQDEQERQANQEQPEGDRQQQEQQAKQDQQGGDEQKEDQEPQQAPQSEQQAPTGGAEQAAEKSEGELSRQEATAILDSQRDQEVRPDEIVRKLQGAVVAEPAQDW